jgi:hypothetical protein
MRKAIFALLVISFLAISISVVEASQVKNTAIDAGYTNTLTFNLSQGDHFSGSISITGGSGNDINFKITNPQGTLIADYGRVSQGRSFDFQADQSGAYKLVLDNSFSLFSSKSVAVTYDVVSPTQPPFFGGNNGGGGSGLDSNLLLIIVVIIAVIIVVAVLVSRNRKKTVPQNYYPPPPPPP